MQKTNEHSEYIFNINNCILKTQVQSECWEYFRQIKEINYQNVLSLPFTSREKYKTFDDAEVQMFHFILDTFQVDEKEKLSIHEYLISKDPKMQDFISLRKDIEWKKN